MMFLVYFLLSLVALVRSQQYYCGKVGNADTHQMTVILFRHGDRSPLNTYPNDPYQEDYWDKYGGWACLTQVGMEQHFRFGRWVRHCYGPVMNETYIPKEVYIRSTDIDRTIESGLAHIAGIFAPHGFQIWSEDPDVELAKLWQPVPIHTLVKPDEYLLEPATGNCPPFIEMQDRIWETDAKLVKTQQDYQGLLDYIADKAGLTVPGRFREVCDAVTDAVNVETIKKLPLPGWINSTILAKLIEWKDAWLYVNNANDAVVKLGMGDFVYNLRQMFQNKTTNKISYKHVLYSAHDSSIAGMLYVFDKDWVVKNPPYASGLFTELHKDTTSGRYFVRVFFRNDTKADPVEIKIRDCGEPCWLEDFDKAVEPFSISNRKEVCLIQPSPSVSLFDEDAKMAICIVATFVGTFLLSMFLFLVILPKCKCKK